jgi:L-aspartate oxidase
VSLGAEVGASTREALWRDAGLRRTREGLERLLEDPYPLARLVAICALARNESRGAHGRTDFPETDPALDAMHAVVDAGGAPALERWE